MKKLLLGLLTLTSLSSYSQVIEIDDSVYEAMLNLTKSHTESSGVEQIKQEIENKYSVKCVGNSSSVFPDVTKQVKYSAKCIGEKNLKLTIKSKFKTEKSGYDFSVKSYIVEF
jgi:hypothetical protein